MPLQLFGPSGMTIATVDDWFRAAPPKGGHEQWVDDRSAKELAKAWCAAGGPCLPSELDDALGTVAEFRGASFDRAYPECRIPFDNIPGERRNADLVALGRAACGSISLSVEAKADEEFGAVIADVLLAGARKRAFEIPTRIIDRVERLTAALLPTRIGGTPRVGDLRYQLLTATAGALAFAKTKGAAVAILMIHEFRSARTSDARLADNQHDLDQFLTRLSNGKWTAIHAGAIVGPISVPGSDFIPSSIPLYIGKIRRDLTARPA